MKQKYTPTQVQYRELCHTEALPLMLQYWWLDAVCPGQWDVFLYKESGHVVASFAYHIRRKGGMRFLLLPPHTQYGGLWIKNTPTDYTQRLTYEKRLMTHLIERIDSLRLHYAEINLHFSITNHLPFHWKGWKQTTRYTYLIDRIGNTEKCVSRFSPAKQRQIRKAQGRFTLDMDLSPDEFYAFHKTCLHDSGRGSIDYDYAFFLRLWKAATARKQGQIFALRDREGRIHTAHFIVWDRASAYDLLYFIRPEYASSGASTLIVMEILQYLQQKTRAFDFEGSMIEGVENSYRQFGTQQRPYHHLVRPYSPLAAWLLRLKQRLRK